MKKLILTCALLTSVTLLSFGQNAAVKATPATNANAQTTRSQGPSTEKMAEMRATRYKQQLGLTDAQYKSVYDAELEYVNAQQSFRSSGQPVPDGPAQQMMMTHDKKFQAAMTADQYAKYDKMRATNRPGSMPAPNNAAPANH